MRTISLVLWLMLAVLMAAYHHGPGQRELQLDVTDGHIASAERAAANGFWVEAEEHYDSSISASAIRSLIEPIGLNDSTLT